MFEWTVQHIVFIVGVVLLTSIAAYNDTRHWKIPNKLTVPFFALGLIYQVCFGGFGGLLDGMAGFAIGFGTYFVLFFIAGGGAGDVKLIGSLSVWLGFKMTLLLMIVSTVVVIVDVALITIYTVLRYGTKKWKDRYLGTGKVDSRGKPVFKKETIEEKQKRRYLPFAVPVAASTWLLMLLNGAGFIKEGQLGPPRATPQPQQQVQVDR